HQQSEKYLRNRPSGNPGAISAQIRAEGQAKGWTQSQISAVITRRISMLTSSVAPSAPAVADAKLRLFAPAIMGARPSRLLGWLDASVIGRVLRPYFQASVAYNDMCSGSEILTAIRDRTEFYSEHYPELSALRAEIVCVEKAAGV